MGLCNQRNIPGFRPFFFCKDCEGRGAVLGSPPHLTPSAPQQDYLSITSSLETGRVDEETESFLLPNSGLEREATYNRMVCRL